MCTLLHVGGKSRGSSQGGAAALLASTYAQRSPGTSTQSSSTARAAATSKATCNDTTNGATKCATTTSAGCRFWQAASFKRDVPTKAPRIGIQESTIWRWLEKLMDEAISPLEKQAGMLFYSVDNNGSAMPTRRCRILKDDADIASLRRVAYRPSWAIPDLQICMRRHLRASDMF